MNILYDHQSFAIYKYGGIARYCYELITRIKDFDDVNVELSLKYSNSHYLEGSNLIKYKRFLEDYEFRGKSRIMILLNEGFSKKHLIKQNFDIFHPTYYYPYFLDYIGKKPFVLTVHDMIHETFPGMFSEKDKTIEWKKLLVDKATKIIAISNNTKNDIIKHYGTDEKKIEVIYQGSSLNIGEVNSNSEILIPNKYILFVGSRGKYKNFNFFIKAVTPLLLKDEELNVVSAGGGDFSKEEVELFKSLGISKKVLQYKVTDNVLANLYRNALVFVFPSLYEGFGIPVLESFECGCPLILSDSSSFLEVAEDSAIYFDPKDEISLIDAVTKMVYDEELRKIMISKGYQQVKKFSWKKTAKETELLYRSLL